MSQPLSCEKCGTDTYLRDGYECPECYSPEKRANRAERERDEARAKVERLRRALFEFAFNWLPDFEEEYSELDTAAPLMAELRAALEDK